VQRCEGCGKTLKGAKKPKPAITLEKRLVALQQKQEKLEAELTACLMEQAAITKKIEANAEG
jgi:hypothetical protein